MSRIHCPRGMRLLATVAAVGMGGLVSLSAASAPAAGAATPAPQHYLCYQAAAKSGFKVPQGIRLINALGAEWIRPDRRSGECALQPGAEGGARRAVPDHESDLALSRLGDRRQAACVHRDRDEPIRHRVARHESADRAVGALVEEPDRTAEPTTDDAPR